MDFYFTTTVETHASAVVITSPVAVISILNETSLSGSATTEAEEATSTAVLSGTAITEPESATLTADLTGIIIDGDGVSTADLTAFVVENDSQTADINTTVIDGDSVQTADLSGTVVDGADITLELDSTILNGEDVVNVLTGDAIEGDPSPSVALIGDIAEGSDLSIVGSVYQEIGDAQVDFSIGADAITEGDISTTLIAVGKTFTSVAFYAQKLVVEEGDDITNELTLESLIFQEGSTDIYGTVVETDTAPTVDVISPLTIFSGALIDNFNLNSDVAETDYNANVTLAAYSALLTVPFQQTNEVTVGSESIILQQTGDVSIGGDTTLSLLTSIENLNFMLTTDIADSSSIRYEVADIDRNLQKGKFRIFPNEWTLSYINNPLDADGNMNTVSSFLIPILEETYGASIFTKISLITARNPLTGVLYNFVFQDEYRTPAGTINDFELCYLLDGVFYPIPFMVKSITSEELEIVWDLEQEV